VTLSPKPHTHTYSLPSPFTGSKFPNYNIREYVRRRAREQFKEASKVSDEGQLTELWSKGKETIEMVKRQAVVYQLYARKQKSVMDM
jgi:LYR motif-containing protein 4